MLRLTNGVLSHSIGVTDDGAPARAESCPPRPDRKPRKRRETLAELSGLAPGRGLEAFRQIIENLDEFNVWFPIIEP